MVNTRHENKWETTKLACRFLDETKPEKLVTEKNRTHVRTGTGLNQNGYGFNRASFHQIRDQFLSADQVVTLAITPSGSMKKPLAHSPCPQGVRAIFSGKHSAIWIEAPTSFLNCLMIKGVAALFYCV